MKYDTADTNPDDKNDQAIKDIIKDALGTERYNKASPQTLIVVTTVTTLILSVFSNSYDDAKNFVDELQKMMNDEMYIPDKPIKMPGKNLKSEKLLRIIMGRLLGRRI